MPNYSKSQLETYGLSILKNLAGRDGILPKGDKRAKKVWIEALLDPDNLATRVPPVKDDDDDDDDTFVRRHPSDPAKGDKKDRESDDEGSEELLIEDPVGDALRDAIEATRVTMEALHIALEEHQDSRR